MDTPVVEYIVREALEAGIKEIILVTSPGQSLVEEHFEQNALLENQLRERNRADLLKRLLPYHELATIISVKQNDPLGLAHAILITEELVKNEPFAVLLGDDLFSGTPSPLSQLLESFEVLGKSVIAIQEVPKSEVVHYGIVEGKKEKNHLYRVSKIVEKPRISEAPSQFAIPGRYLFTPEVFSHLHQLAPTLSGEYQLTEALESLARSSGLYAFEISAKRYDVGQAPGFLKATLDFAWTHPSLHATITEWFKTHQL